jgi:crotonobetainyl-CoA:carnitine CoA-transferase CaiB-like acyl-CoA transferase
MESLDAQMDEAKIATGQVRTLKEFAAGDWARDWHAVRTVPDGQGGEFRIPGRPWRFNDELGPDDRRFAARQGEHNTELLAELGYRPEDIVWLETLGALVEPDRRRTEVDARITT